VDADCTAYCNVAWHSSVAALPECEAPQGLGSRVQLLRCERCLAAHQTDLATALQTLAACKHTTKPNKSEAEPTARGCCFGHP